MWFFAWREIRHGWVRFALVSALVGLVAFLVFVLTGLSVGLGEAGVSGLRRLPADSVVFAEGADRVLARSDLPPGLGAALGAVPGVRSVEPVGQLTVSARTGTTALPLALLGVRPGAGFAAKTLADGQVVLDSSVKNVFRGDVLTLQPGGLRLAVTGFADLGTLQHTALGQVTLATWQHARPRGTDTVSAFLVRGSAPPAALEHAAPGTEAVSKDAAVGAVPGYAQETGTIDLIRGFLLAIAALLIGTVFWIFTLQKEGSVAVLRATGASRRLLLSSYLAQVLATTSLGLAVAFGAVLAAKGLLPATVFALRPADLVTAAGLLGALALAASAVSLRRLLTVDPLLAIGRMS